MVAAQVIGNDATITIAGQSGNFQLNVMLPVIAYNLLESIRLLANVRARWPTARIAGFTVNEARLAEALERNPILVTALNPVIGYEKGAAIAKKAYAEGQADSGGGAADDRPAARASWRKLLDPAGADHAAASRAAPAAAAERFDCRPGRPGTPAAAPPTGPPIIRERLRGSEPQHRVEEWRVPGLSADGEPRFRQHFPPDTRCRRRCWCRSSSAPSAHRAADPARQRSCSNHAGQISFPGGRIETGRCRSQRGRLREAHEEIGPGAGLRHRWSVTCPITSSMTGFRVTPVVAFVRPGFELLLDSERGRGHLRGAAGFRVRSRQSSARACAARASPARRWSSATFRTGNAISGERPPACC